MEPKKINVSVDGEFAGWLASAASRGISAADATAKVAQAVTAACAFDDALAGRILRGIIPTEGSAFRGEEFEELTSELPVAIHIGAPRSVENCPFGRAEVGLDAGERDPEILLERTFAEWRISRKTKRHRDLVVIYKNTEPVACYRNFVWSESPDERLDGVPGRQNKGRHYLASGDVTFFELGTTYRFSTEVKGRFIRAQLTDGEGANMDMSDEVLAYLASHTRQRKAVQQPLDLLDMEYTKA
ncbi:MULTISPECIES: hypothetical protein [Glutamicibacter]|uniref:hypothetical protein n=1 Tax=Glutamicibacter TaxID=1742989 RepID=UPI000EBABE46|nr:hypothetical protein [Glutamicibacter sp.]HCJ53369.1 hypothetical protein [Glutamicibacter sp.]